MTERPRVLIEDWLPVAELGIESVRERKVVMDLPPLFGIHVWWARRPLVASAGAILGSIMPIWSEDLAKKFPDDEELASATEYHRWFLRLCGILGDPLAGKASITAANERGEKLSGNGYGYKQAYKNSPSEGDLGLLHQVLRSLWGDLPVVLDPTAGGGSIPFQSCRYGLSTTANDLNSIAAAVMRAAVEMPATYGSELLTDLERFGQNLVQRVRARLEPAFPMEDDRDQVVAYLWARTVICPRTGKPIPLAPNWWLSRGKKKNFAVRLLTHIEHEELDQIQFEVVFGSDINFDPDKGTVAGGIGVSPWDGLTVDGDYIKSEALAGRMGSVMYAVSYKSGGVLNFRVPSERDLEGVAIAESSLEEVVAEWRLSGLIPVEEIPDGNKTREVGNFGITFWADMFSSRQLLVHGTFVDEYRKLYAEARDSIGHERSTAVFSLLSLLIGKAVDWNSLYSSWKPTQERIAHSFVMHAFPFRWTFAEFDGSRQLYQWALDRGVIRAYRSLAALLVPSPSKLDKATYSGPVPGRVTVIQGNAADLRGCEDDSQSLICIDPPYYDNVMYAELADFFYVWEKRTLGFVTPELFTDELTDKKNEAVANVARFADSGKRKKELANADYEAKMTAIFTECHRVLKDDGVLTVMFTHKKAEAWDTLGMSLMEAGFTIETSWPVATESEQSLHQAKQNSASTTIFLVCRKRVPVGGSVFFEDVEAQVRDAARNALTKFSRFGIDGVDLLLSTYGPALSVISSQWPVYSSEANPTTGKSRLLRPEEALDAARGELVRLQRQRLIGRAAQLDPVTDFVLLSWEIFKAREFPFDEARRLALAVGGLDVETLVRAKVVEKRSGTVSLLAPEKRVRRKSDLEDALPGVYLEATSFPVVIDAVHTAMHLAEQDGPAAAKAWLDRVGLVGDQRFQAALQGLVNAMPRSKTKDKWDIAEAEWLDAVRFYFPEVTVPEAKMVEEVLTPPSLFDE